MPASVLICLSNEERTESELRWRSGRTEARMKEHLPIVLLADDGLTKEEISQAMPVIAHKAVCWRNQFSEEGLCGIEKNLPRGANHGGANSRTQASLRQNIIKITTNKSQVARRLYALEHRNIGAEVEHQPTHDSKSLDRVWFKPQLISQFKTSNDPHFQEKLEDVLGFI